MDPATLLSLLAFLLVLTALMYLGGPILVRLLHVQPAHPEFVSVAADTLPDEVVAFFAHTSRTLAPEGFEPAVCLSQVQRAIGTVLQLYVNRDKGDLAMAAAMYQIPSGHSAPRLASAYVEFCTVFSDDCEVCTNNSSTANPLPAGRFPNKIVLQFAGARDLSDLYRVHSAAASHVRPGVKGILPDPGAEQSALNDAFAKDLPRFEEIGYMYLDRSRDAYRPTWKGAYLMSWKSIWPGSAIAKARARRRGAAFLSEIHEIPPS